MPKKTTQYVCNNCGEDFTKWSGRCESCGEWGTLVEFRESKLLKNGKATGNKLEATVLSAISVNSSSKRLNTAIDEVNEVFGGGIVPGSISLIAGEPGIGKSTLLLQVAIKLAAKHKILYVSGEESAQQIKLRADRLGLPQNELELAASVSANDIAASISRHHYDLVIVDSIQTVAVDEIGTSAGSVSQITNSAQMLQQAAKAGKTALILVGHVTKEGSIAGPKILEHLVDVVLNLEGDRYGGFKILRAAKNRFGSTNEIGIFEMEDKGLIPIKNPSAALLAERQVSDGSVVLATIEGNRALLVEVQALVIQSNFGYPKRTAVGIDLNRLNLLIAVLSRRTKLDLGDKDVYVNIVGGVKAQEPATDLAIAMAIASAAKGMKLKEDLVVFGEIGLSGEVRHVPALSKRLAEAKKLGFKGAIGPKSKDKVAGLASVASLRDALNTYLT